MIGQTVRQSALFYAPLDQQASLLKDDLLDPVDALLDDAELVALVRDRLARRSDGSPRTGRPSIAPDRLLRCAVLKHLKAWSYRTLERELRSNIVYRRFTHFDADATPDHSTLSRNISLLGGRVMKAVHNRVVAQACEKGVARGNRMRTDTTVVETNIHHPTDSTLLGDGVRVLTRLLKRVSNECGAGAVNVVDHRRAVKLRILEIVRAAKSFKDAGKQRLQDSYQKLVATTQAVARQAARVLDDLEAGRLAVVGNARTLVLASTGLRHYLPLVHRVIAQTKARVFQGDNHVPDKLLSIFETHSQVIRKGKPHKPTEFGRLVRLDEVENGIVTGVEVLKGNRADTTAFLPAVDNHLETFRRPPHMATGDRGYFSAENESKAQEKGVKRVALPARGRLSESRRQRQKARWFKRAQRWRSGIEGRIGTLKHSFGMLRAMAKREDGFERYVGWCVIAHNLVSTARTVYRRSRGSEGG